MKFKGIIEPLLEDASFMKLKEHIKNNKYPIEIDNISESSRAYIIKGIYESIEKPIVILSNNDIEAKKLYDDLSLFIYNVYLLPCKDMGFYNADAISGDIRWERLKILEKIFDNKKKVIVTTIDAATSIFAPIDIFKDNIFKLSVGDNLDVKKFIGRLIKIGYERVFTVEQCGQVSTRGGIIDIFPPTSEFPYRIELFDDEIDSIRTFSPQTQRSIDKSYVINIFPAKEIILYDDNIKLGCELITKDLEKTISELNKEKKFSEVKKIKALVNENLEFLKEKGTFQNIDSYLPYFYSEPSNFFDYIGDSLIIMDDPKRCEGKLDAIYDQFNNDFELFIDRGNILSKQGELIIPKEVVIDKIKRRALVTIQSIYKTLNYFTSKERIGFKQITLNEYGGQFDLLTDYIKEKKQEKFKILILSGTKGRGNRLIETFRDKGIEVTYRDKIDEIFNGEVVVTEGSQLKGYEFSILKVAVISDKGIFGEAKKKTKPKKIQKGVNKIKSFTDLKLGDYVVHSTNGIGIYKGIKQIEIKGIQKDYLEIEYAKNDRLYVPVYQLDLVQKYIGSEGKNPKINRLSSLEWTKAKKKAKKAIEEIAEELVKLYASRSLETGYKYSKDNVWQNQFEEEFPYVETPDQLNAISDIKNDMETGKVMDRLLCGDVGYGKTEVALRAAFKAVMDGKQVAVLVPTTILAKQHYSNFIKRFSSFPVNIEMVCRFRTPLEQRKSLKKLSEGNLDIIIGTHRILQKDVSYKDLGLLIIDEEQRFGVKHKEKIKELKKSVDVLTLSATPIPRTLHMSLTGVRDISVIETAPEERYPIQTYVIEFNEQLIREAIIKEISRDGQVFFVYNRVETIHKMKLYLNELIPEARIAIGHGQMTERELENVMNDFMEGQYDVLLCTTIIETGIDIQNCNTMIIYDSDKMGLSQLYQLRGRVGRSNRIAYAYFTYKKDKEITELAEKRLKAIKEFTELGSGFKIAMRDLEIRGAGNMMGSAQHGQMASIGYDLYCKMLEEAVGKLRGETHEELLETSVDIRINAFIPDSYINSQSNKIELYKKIAAIDSLEDVEDIRDELIDRYADIPTDVDNLIDISYLKSVANKLGICDLKEVNEKIEITFESKDRLSKGIINKILTKYRSEIVVRLGDIPLISYRTNGVKRKDVIKRLIEILLDLKTIV